MEKRNLLYYIYCALGEKASQIDREADKVAFIRLLMFLSILITNCFIVAGVVRHFNDKTTVEVHVNKREVSSDLSEKEKEQILKANSRRFPYD